MEVNSSPDSELTSPLLATLPQPEDDNDGIRIQLIRTSNEEVRNLLGFRIRQRRWLRCYQNIVLALSLPPLYFLAMEMTQEHCHFCQHAIDDNPSNPYIIVAAALWGSLMVTLYDRSHLWASIFGGAVAASGSLFTMWMLLKSITSNDVVFVFALLVGILGAMPGIMIHFVAKILCEEWSRSAPSIQSQPKRARERIMSDGTVPEVVEEEEIV